MATAAACSWRKNPQMPLFVVDRPHMHSARKWNLRSEKDLTVKSRTAIRAGAVPVGNCTDASHSRSRLDSSSAGRPAVDAVTSWDEILLAGGAGQPSSIEPLPNFGEIAPHVVCLGRHETQTPNKQGPATGNQLPWMSSTPLHVTPSSTGRKCGDRSRETRAAGSSSGAGRSGAC